MILSHRPTLRLASIAASALALLLPSVASAQNVGAFREAARSAMQRRQWAELSIVCERAMELHGASALFAYGSAYAAFMQGNVAAARAGIDLCIAQNDHAHTETCRELAARLPEERREETTGTVATQRNSTNQVNGTATLTVREVAPGAARPTFHPPRQVVVLDSSARTNTGAVITMALGGAAVMTAGILYVLHTEAASGCAGGESGVALCPTEEARERAENSRALAVAGNVTLGVGLSGIVGGVLWWAIDRRRTSERPLVTVHAERDGATVLVRGSF